MNNDGPLKILHILLYWEFLSLRNTLTTKFRPEKDNIKKHNATICIFAFYRPRFWKYRTLMKVYQRRIHFSLCRTVFERWRLQMSPGCQGNMAEQMIRNYFHIICSHEISEVALGRKSLGLVIIVVDFFMLKKINVFPSGGVCICQPCSGKGKWDGWPTYDSRQKRYIDKKK